ncbi:histidine phosphatase family protein [Vagococcus sp. DIV0080]|uniref:Histidine phosphatase family protein n=1 Tax=Candidatus Vagococcus giribetii TaxID=2230876 RepID=A0ABS3HTJ5_9ENTE|nr:histidine phosphatase family protein [Vagococcus sp. DIV0080]MBO0477072.1 histidine phosphatase family protein [Vagococcus sp. DIV0080]
MTTFYCVRHGKTEFNLNRVFQGGLADSPLLPEGIENAKKVGEHLKDITFEAAFVSPQTRAQDTAKNILLGLTSPLELNTVKDLREMEFGEWDGQPESIYEKEEEFQNLVHCPHLYNPSEFGGETFEELIERALAVFKKISLAYPNGNVLVVSHGLTLQSILKHLDGSSIADIRSGRLLDNTSITIIDNTKDFDTYEMVKWNDTSHLA